MCSTVKREEPEVENLRWQPFIWNCYVFGSSNPTESLGIIFSQTGSGKSKMAAIKLEVLISRLLDKIGTRFLLLCLRGSAIQRNY